MYIKQYTPEEQAARTMGYDFHEGCGSLVRVSGCGVGRGNARNDGAAMGFQFVCLSYWPLVVGCRLVRNLEPCACG